MIRVRFAPSPTGFLHLGSLRAALYDFLFAKKNKGKFILRIENTDIKREVKGAIESLIKTLKLMGLEYDEGPFLNSSDEIIEKGDYGPYFQSKRLNLYQEVAQELIKKNKAYYCFCSQETLEQMKKEQAEKHLPPAYDKRCRNLNREEITLRLRSGQSYVIRLKIPEEGKIKFKDLIRGEVEFDLKNIDDQVLLKSDGYPTYHLAVVVDDHLMKITHIIRGEEWLPSMPKHILIYQALGWDLPEFAHLPLILNPDKSKLSKRQGDVAVEDYLAQGYLPEALINFIALLGWSAQSACPSEAGRRRGSAHERSEMSGNPRKEEIFSLEELIREFSLEKIQKAGAVFNREKLDWMNGYYIRKMKVGELTKKCIPYLIKAELIKEVSDLRFQILGNSEMVNFNWLEKIVALEQERMKKLADLPAAVDFFFKDKLEYDEKILIWKKMNFNKVKENLTLVKESLEKITENNFNAKKIQEMLNQLAEKEGTGEIFWPLRVALSGRKASPPPAEIAEILGKAKTLSRISQII